MYKETDKSLTLNKTTIDRGLTLRFRGLNIDQQLAWNTHINKQVHNIPIYESTLGSLNK